ncbi:protein kinase domain-containing protein [Ditylenchus destructor]|uniref:Protein kinase domain-containing protein n=1 Tax=Ditylenchus destructor TaxID=166010 RepID=A0AAD4RAK7_9BILA|nr:protein kinase domain-containing protein [Ditylenchus destructor]
MASVLSSFFSRDPRTAFPYELPSDSFTNYKGTFLGHSLKKAESNEKATCFWTNSWNSSLKLQAQKLKTLRHPNILTYLDFLEVESSVYLITEPCRPLEYYLSEIKLTDTQKELLVSWGLYQILNCLKFLHGEAKIEQNNIKESIYVTASGDWKLSGFQNTAPFSSPQRDLNDLAAVIWQIFNGFKSDVPESASRSITRIPKRLQPLYKRLETRGKSTAVSDLLTESRATGGFMKNKFVDTLLFLDEFQLKESSEKQHFFSTLKDNLDMFPEDVAKYKILPKLIHSYEYGDAGSVILGPMFKLAKLLDEDEYQYRIVPCLVKLFSSTDRTTRVKLLEGMDEYAPHLKPQIINDSIFGNLVSGFTDTSPAVRESTVKAMVTFAEKLNYHNLNNDLMKYLARLQGGDEQPGIRTNTTICLGKIGCYIDPSHRQRILISAFTRALKDPFPPARMSGVLALSATQQYYSLVEVASKILPALCLLTVDPEKQVRDQGFKAINGFLEKLEKASENPELIPEMEAQVKAGGKSSLLSADKVPQWAGWALKALSGKFYKSSTQNSAGASITNATKSYGSSSNIPVASTGTAARSTTPSTNDIISMDENVASSKSSQAGDLLDGWGELEDEADVDSESKDVQEVSEFGIGDDWNSPSEPQKEESIDGWGAEWEQPSAMSSNASTSRPGKHNSQQSTVKAAPKVAKGGPMKLGAKKVSNTANTIADLEKDLFK